ncbi:MAG: lipopolysaccharide kinase InaA family protein [Pseudoflavonifractor sp.]|nr:lipopolysaccharide kinase InaA family protein [Pseudoflavonifractor sp.]
MDKVVISPRHERLRGFVESVPAMFDRGEGRLLFEGRNEIRLFDYGDERVVVKRYRRLNGARALSYTLFSSSKASRAYRFAIEMECRGVDTPEAMAYIEIWRHGLLRDCYFVSAYTDDMPLFDPLVGTPRYDRGLAADVAEFIASMHARGVVHGDPNLANILYHDDPDGRRRFSVIDTNRSRFYNSEVPRRVCIANLKRVTHRRDLLRDIVTRYAAVRGWDAAATMAEVERLLSRFERNRRRRHAISRFFGGHPR